MVGHRLAVGGYYPVHVHHVGDALWADLGHAGDDHSSVGMAHQHHILKTFVAQHLNNVLDVDVQCDIGWVEFGVQVGALTHAGERGREDFGSGLSE